MSEPQRVDFDELEMTPDLAMTFGGQLFTGIAFETRPDGSLESETAFRDGLQTGICRRWSPSGALLVEDNFWIGSKHGVCRTWFDGGQPASEATYEYSIKTSERTWDRNGRLLKDWRLAETDPNFASLELLRKSYANQSTLSQKPESR